MHVALLEARLPRTHFALHSVITMHASPLPKACDLISRPAVCACAGAVAGSAIGSERGPGGGSMDMQHAYGMDPDRLTHHMPDMGRDPMMKPPQSGSTQE